MESTLKYIYQQPFVFIKVLASSIYVLYVQRHRTGGSLFQNILSRQPILVCRLTLWQNCSKCLTWIISVCPITLGRWYYYLHVKEEKDLKKLSNFPKIQVSQVVEMGFEPRLDFTAHTFNHHPSSIHPFIQAMHTFFTPAMCQMLGIQR